MKTFIKLFFAILFLASALAFASCEKEPLIQPTSPIITDTINYTAPPFSKQEGTAIFPQIPLDSLNAKLPRYEITCQIHSDSIINVWCYFCRFDNLYVYHLDSLNSFKDTTFTIYNTYNKKWMQYCNSSPVLETYSTVEVFEIIADAGNFTWPQNMHNYLTVTANGVTKTAMIPNRNHNNLKGLGVICNLDGTFILKTIQPQ